MNIYLNKPDKRRFSNPEYFLHPPLYAGGEIIWLIILIGKRYSITSCHRRKYENAVTKLRIEMYLFLVFKFYLHNRTLILSS